MLAQQILQALPAAADIMLKIGPRAQWAEFLFFTLDLIVGMPPSVLMPAPAGSRPVAGPVQRLPTRYRQPGGHDCQAQWRPVRRKNVQQTRKPPAGCGNIIGPEKY
jgi:hypothetical protein